MVDLVAVLTGDIVGSSKLSHDRLSRSREVIQQAAEQLALHDNKGGISRIDFFRGDSWQLLINDPGYCLRCALFLRASLRARIDIDTRVAIGIGTTEEVVEHQISLSTGEAFVRSGKALEQLTRLKRFKYLMSIVPPETNEALAPWPSLAVSLCDAILVKWTQTQAEIVSFSLLGYTQEEIAQKINKDRSQQAVAKLQKRAGWYALEDALETFESFPWNQTTGQDQDSPD